jgi:hypothetical protein
MPRFPRTSQYAQRDGQRNVIFRQDVSSGEYADVRVVIDNGIDKNGGQPVESSLHF